MYLMGSLLFGWAYGLSLINYMRLVSSIVHPVK